MASNSASAAAPSSSPLGDPQVFSNLMPELFRSYLKYKSDLLRFDWLQKTTDLNVVCRNSTTEEAFFQTPEALENAIQRYTMFDDPAGHGLSLLEPHNDCWGSWMRSALEDLHPGERPVGGPLLDVLKEGLVMGSCRYIKGYTLFRNRPNHWTYLLRDQSPLEPQFRDGENYIMRSEILAIVAIFYNQMNTLDFDVYKRTYVDRMFIYKGGSLTATIVTTMAGKVRVVQASCNPADEYPTLTYTLHGFWDLSMSTYNKTTAQKVVKWLLCPPDPAQTIPLRTL
ncbi:hypothetical protein ACJ73_02053 [Blastomyces percursus]|uniref:Uncharacterized protein n=1 Tax=Blastomyces percursus TaxID=1658174 RepID=A0A1J9R2D1_9EURO|nr:hypothetical protein ACJ73_02053 [Blastomyces percursus]